MNWTRYKLLIVSGALTLVISGGLLFWILSNRSAAGEINQEIQNLKNSLTRLNTAKPFPSERNLQRLREEQEKVVQRRDALLAHLQEHQIAATPVTRSTFGDYIKTLVGGLVRSAPEAKKGGEHGVILVDPDFGMTDFLSGALPDSARIPSLTVELEMLKHLTGLLYEVGISELVLLRAAEKKVVDAAVTTDLLPGMARISPLPGQPAEVDTRPPEVIEKERLFDTLSFRMEFKIYEDYFWELLNRLMADGNQIVVKNLYITNGNEILWPAYLRPAMTGARSSRAERQPPRRSATPRQNIADMFAQPPSPEGEAAELNVKVPGLAERRQHTVGGDLLNVVMELEIYRLKANTNETTPGS